MISFVEQIFFSADYWKKRIDKTNYGNNLIIRVNISFDSCYWTASSIHCEEDGVRMHLNQTFVGQKASATKKEMVSRLFLCCQWV